MQAHRLFQAIHCVLVFNMSRHTREISGSYLEALDRTSLEDVDSESDVRFALCVHVSRVRVM